MDLPAFTRKAYNPSVMNFRSSAIPLRSSQPDVHDDPSLSSEDGDSNKLGETLVRATKFLGAIVGKGHDDDDRVGIDDIDCYHKSLGSVDALNAAEADAEAHAASLNERYDEANKDNLYSHVRSVRRVGGAAYGPRDEMGLDHGDLSMSDGSDMSIPTIEEGGDGRGRNDKGLPPRTIQRRLSDMSALSTGRTGLGRRGSSESDRTLLGKMESLKHLFPGHSWRASNGSSATSGAGDGDDHSHASRGSWGKDPLSGGTNGENNDSANNDILQNSTGSFNASFSSVASSAGNNLRPGPINSHGAGDDALSPSITGHHAEARAKFTRRNVKHAAKSSESFRYLQAMMKERGAITGNAVAHLLQEVAEEHALRQSGDRGDSPMMQSESSRFALDRRRDDASGDGSGGASPRRWRSLSWGTEASQHTNASTSVGTNGIHFRRGQGCDDPTAGAEMTAGTEATPQTNSEARRRRLDRDPLFGCAASLSRPYIPVPSREGKTDALVAVLRRAADQGQSCLLNVRGSRFVGKTRLVRRAMDDVQAQGLEYTVLRSRRSAGDALTSFFAFREVVSRALRECDAATGRSDASPADDNSNNEDEDEEDTDEAIVRRLVRRKILNKSDRLMIGRVLPAVMSDQLLSLLKGRNPTALTKDLAGTLFKIIIPLQPVMLLFEADGDDCNIDPSSWDLMEELLLSASKQCPQMLLVAMSRRPLSNIPVSIGGKHYVDVNVERMDRDDTEGYVRALFCDPHCIDRNMRVDPSVVDGVYNRARGCPLFTERIVLWAQARELIELDETRNAVAMNLPEYHRHPKGASLPLGLSREESLLDTLPANLNEEILDVINNLPHHLLDALKVAACMGIAFDMNKYQALKSDEGLHDSLQELTASHRIFEEAGGCYRWKHVAVHEAVESIIISNERTEIRSRIADSLLRKGEGSHSSEDAHQYARHCAMAERWDEAFDRYMEAGGAAEEKLDFNGAVGMYQQAKMCLKRSERKPSLQRKLSPHAALGWCLRELFRYEDAEKELEFCLKQTMAVPQKRRNSQFEQIELDVVTTLATLKQAQSKYDEAVEMFERALPIARANKEKHTRVWLAHHVASCAEIHRKSGDLQRARALHTEALGYRELAVEEQSCTILELALSFTQLGCTLSGLGDHHRACGLHRKALAARAEHLDFCHALVSESLNYCADALQALRKGGEGIPLGLHAVEIRKVVFGPHHPAYAHALSVLASCYHSVGRSFDSLGLLKECLEICERAFSKDHANMIPNLKLFGSVLSDMGKHEQARDVYERALCIHNMNFKEGQNTQQLVKLQRAIKELASGNLSESQAAKASLETPIPSFEPDDDARTHIIICADIGHRASDEYMLSVASSLQRMGTLKLMSVIAVSSPQVVRADIARGALDSLLLSNVPVAYSGVVGGGPATTFGADHVRSFAHVNGTGVELMTRALLKAPEKSLVIMGTACLGDISEVINNHRDLFASKVKQVVVVGSVKHARRRSFIEPEEVGGGGAKDHAYAKNVYRSCQDLGIPTVTLFKDVSRGFPFPSEHVDDLVSSNHVVARKIKRAEEMRVKGVWELIKQQESSRSSYFTPMGVDAKSFYKYSLGGKHPNVAHPNIWPSIKSINLELVLGLLCCIPVYRDSHFKWETHQVKGVDHKVCRHTSAAAGIKKSDALSNEIHMLIGFALRTSLQNTSC